MKLAIALILASLTVQAQPIIRYSDGQTFPPQGTNKFVFPEDDSNAGYWEYPDHTGDPAWYWTNGLHGGLFVIGWYNIVSNYTTMEDQSGQSVTSKVYSVYWSTNDFKTMYPEVFSITGATTVATDNQGQPVIDPNTGYPMYERWIEVVYDSNGMPLVTNVGACPIVDNYGTRQALPVNEISQTRKWPICSTWNKSRLYVGVATVYVYSMPTQNLVQAEVGVTNGAAGFESAYTNLMAEPPTVVSFGIGLFGAVVAILIGVALIAYLTTKIWKGIEHLYHLLHDRPVETTDPNPPQPPPGTNSPPQLYP